MKLDFPDDSAVKNVPVNAEDTGHLGSISGSGRSPGRGNGNPLQYSSLENPMDRGSWGCYSPYGCKEPDVSEHEHVHIMCEMRGGRVDL